MNKTKIRLFKFVWDLLSIAIGFQLEETYDLGFFKYLLIVVPLLLIGEFLVYKIFKVKN